MENSLKPTITDELIAQFEGVLFAFNSTRMIMDEPEARATADEIIIKARQVLMNFKRQQIG